MVIDASGTAIDKSLRQSRLATVTTQEENKRPEPVISSATGDLFKGKRFRTYEGEKLFQNKAIEEMMSQRKNTPTKASELCSKWSVVTTIYAPSEAVLRASSLPGWCTIIVADVMTPKDYMDAWNETTRDGVHFLSVQDQKELLERHWQGSSAGDFLEDLSFRHFGRKNLGFLYAIKHGAQFIFDFDDDNILKLDSKSNATTLPPTELPRARVVALGQKLAMNPYPLMGAPKSSWPRGFPLDLIKDSTTWGEPVFIDEKVEMSKIGIIQMCADKNPDVDAIYRLVRPLPMNFDTTIDTTIIVPPHSFVPYNAQATVHTAAGLWATLLPMTVPGRVSDIWRSYFAQALFREMDLRVAYAPPQVVQERNEHNLLADKEAEHDLYFKTNELLSFLNDWSSQQVTLPARMEQLWIDLYERGYIDLDDVRLVQLWLQSLIDHGYKFPAATKRRRHRNVVLMGQFNYASPLQNVVFWVQKWREVFHRIEVRGPFNETQLEDLRTSGISVYYGKDDRGHTSPVENLIKSLQLHRDDEQIGGVIYLHDDAFLNENELTNGRFPFPVDEIIGSRLRDFFPHSYVDPMTVNDTDLLSSRTFKVNSNGTLMSVGTKASTFNHFSQLARTFQGKPWPLWKFCIPQLQQAVNDTRFQKKYSDSDGSFWVPSPTQADFLFVPIGLADAFSEAGQVLLDNKVFLECGLPTLVQMLRKTVDTVTSRVIELCTTWFPRRGREKMMNMCIGDKNVRYGMYHPFKISIGLDVWGSMFDRVTFTSNK